MKRIVEIYTFFTEPGQTKVTIEFEKPSKQGHDRVHYVVYTATPRRIRRLLKLQVDYYMFNGTVSTKTYVNIMSTVTQLEFPAKM